MTVPDISEMLPRLPDWVWAARRKEDADLSFVAGAALGHLHQVLVQDGVPQTLLRDRLALLAAEGAVRMSGRPERAADLRDTLHLLRPGDMPGPAGETYLAWRRTVHKALPPASPLSVQPVLDACQVLEAAVADDPRALSEAAMKADAALAAALGWPHVVPVLGLKLQQGDLRLSGAALVSASHRAVVEAVCEIVPLAADLARRAAQMRQVAPKLRAKAAPAAVEMFLSQDAVAPMALPLPDRSARRLCDRLVTLGAARELTGRETFRLYGLGP